MLSFNTKIFFSFAQKLRQLLIVQIWSTFCLFRFSLLINEVLSGPVLYHEYKKLLLEEVSHPRFFWGVSSYAEIDTNGDGKITEDEIGKTKLNTEEFTATTLNTAIQQKQKKLKAKKSEKKRKKIDPRKFEFQTMGE